MEMVFRILFTIGAMECVAYVVAVSLRARGKSGDALRLLAHPRVLATGLALGIGGLVVDYLWTMFAFPF
ncbi:hypothetical protein HDA40_006424 [Hamadaea flava]|uniref:Uncharacterized protein n=1 Tax=Hamadaea flava TaxID=1742688 RepID=A0ABV8LV77_9ACTN|nr:hypothetical protein [Hamadaea flava]MCP2327917.1 hypothetical protein [Hamadaea flava]